MKPIYFDIETGPLPADVRQERIPEFEPDSRLKDPVKIAESIEGKKKAWLGDAALSPITGQVLVIGLLEGDQVKYLYGEEKSFLEQFWTIVRDAMFKSDCLVGFNCNTFDLPFLMKRSWALGVKPPIFLRSGRYWNQYIIDLREIWQLGDRQAHGGLDQISKFFGMSGKAGDGKDFAALWESDQEKALAYLKQDLLLTKGLYDRML
jgi:predicted PolB exonuclease-like 3'-5' exonuclease